MQEEIVTNAVQCAICGAPADMHGSNRFQCQNNPAHFADTMTGIFSDNSMPKDRNRSPLQDVETCRTIKAQ
mgnify:CR=1 FL=1